MKKIIPILLVALAAYGQVQPGFDDYFVDKAMRIDLYFTGDAKEESVAFDRIYQEPIWPENPKQLIEPFENGCYKVQVYDIASNRLIYSRGFNSMFAEYRTTTPAIEGTQRTFERPVRIPYPKNPVLLVIGSRDKKNLLHTIFTMTIDPSDYHILREEAGLQDEIYPALKNGDPHSCVDLLFLSEGYSEADRQKFKDDVDRYRDILFQYEPYKSNKEKFNITGLFRPSVDNGPDEPRQQIYKNTVLNASFNSFDLDRYMLTEENKMLRRIASQVPYDAIVILVNSKRYGGGGIYNDYAITTVDNERSKAVFIHEFGHSFAGLADEYYSSEVAYNDFYPKGVEPLEPNITALLDPAHVKWSHLLSPGIAVPTEYGRAAIDSLEALRRSVYEEMRKDGEKDKAKKEKKYSPRLKKIEEQIKAVRERYKDVYDKVGVFEGAGYSAKGLYRPSVYCLMIYNPKDEFCPVCQDAIRRMIQYYSE